MNLFNTTIAQKNKSRPPIWFMRQAGRYHSHYQTLPKKYSFIELCKKPELTFEATMGPIRDFDFDAAILFSDLLFPLEAMGMGLTYDEGPKLGWHLLNTSDIKKLAGGAGGAAALEFQAEALRLLRARITHDKGLIGFVGGPLTLFCYAVEGTHSGSLASAKRGLVDGRFSGFIEKLTELLAENMVIQAKAGADCIAVFDTCAGEFDPETYSNAIIPSFKPVLDYFKSRCPAVPIIYYSKGTGPQHWKALDKLSITCLGIDWRHNLANVLSDYSGKWAIQGNINPDWLLLPQKELDEKLRNTFYHVKTLPAEKRSGWVCGLGHGVLQKTPEANVKYFIKLTRELFSE
ncbi:MAG: uroporphyrinogen decarboxylase family protein [Bdellovibrionota bacterium]